MKHTLILLFAPLMLSSCAFGRNNNSSSNNKYSYDPPEYKLIVNITSFTFDYNQYLGYTAEIKGTATNNNGVDLSYASVEFTIYNASGNVIGTALDNMNNLSAGETWEFKASSMGFFDSKPETCKLKDTTCIPVY